MNKNGFFQDNRGNNSSKRLGFIIGIICFNAFMFMLIRFLYLLNELNSGTIIALGGFYSTGIGVLATYIVQANKTENKTENKNEKSNNTTTNS